MNPLHRVLSAIADRVHPDQDTTDTTAGLVVEYRPDGTRVAYHPGLPVIAARYRAWVLANPDTIDRTLVTPEVRALAAREAAHLAGYATKGAGPPARQAVRS